MLETSNILVNKMSLPIQKREEIPAERELMGLTKSALYEAVCDYFHTHLDWKSFSNGGPLGNSESRVSGVSVMCSGEEHFAQWALMMNIKDTAYSRRRWKYYLGLTQVDSQQISFFYAKCCYDHMSGSLSPAKPIVAFEDLFARKLFFLPSIQFVCGNIPYPTNAIELNPDTYSSLVDQIKTAERILPIMLITCPDVIIPQKILGLMLGNVIVYWCTNAELIRNLNSDLPQTMYSPWDSIHIFMPSTLHNSFHPVYPYEEIQRMGVDNFIAGLRQAYCQSMRSEERKNFPTVETVNYRRSQLYAHMLYSQREEQRKRILELTAQISAQKEELQAVKKQFFAYKQAHPTDQITEYESLLNESLSEIDLLRKGISDLTSQLFICMGTQLKPTFQQTIPELRELEKAILSTIACASSKKR